MTKTTFFRCLLALTALAAFPFAASNARAGADDILETNETNILRLKPTGGTPTTFVSGLSNPQGHCLRRSRQGICLGPRARPDRGVYASRRPGINLRHRAECAEWAGV